jgi:hypothetical protein
MEENLLVAIMLRRKFIYSAALALALEIRKKALQKRIQRASASLLLVA